MLNLQDLEKKGSQTQNLTLTERLPFFMDGSCLMQVTYEVNVQDDYYLVHLKTQGSTQLICQRCMESWPYHYENQSLIAVCRTDERANELLENYECMTSESLQINLEDLVVDELYLHMPQSHPDSKDCSTEINKILRTH